MALFELDIRAKVGDGDWVSLAGGELPGDTTSEVMQGVAAALREVADAVERQGATEPGAHYAWGTSGSEGMDCSGLTDQSWKRAAEHG